MPVGWEKVLGWLALCAYLGLYSGAWVWCCWRKTTNWEARQLVPLAPSEEAPPPPPDPFVVTPPAEPPLFPCPAVPVPVPAVLPVLHPVRVHPVPVPVDVPAPALVPAPVVAPVVVAPVPSCVCKSDNLAKSFALDVSGSTRLNGSVTINSGSLSRLYVPRINAIGNAVISFNATTVNFTSITVNGTTKAKLMFV